MAAGEPILYSLYVYAPNKGAPIFFAIAYAISAIFHIWQCYRYKAFKLIGLHPLCAVMFTAGYALREYGAYNYIYLTTTKLPLIIFVLSQVFIYVCPPLLELANYRVLARLFYYIPYCAPLPANKILTTFGALMMLVETLNSLGVALAANSSSSTTQQALGSHLTIAALSIQFVVIIIFVCLASIFHLRCKRERVQVTAVYTLLFTLYVSMALILVRCVYRLVEHTGNTKIDISNIDERRTLSSIVRYEVFFYIFEATLMLLNSILWNVWNPCRYLAPDNRVSLARDGSELMGTEDKDERSVVEKMGNVLTFGILFRRKKGGKQVKGKDERSLVEKTVNVATFGVLCRRKRLSPRFEELGEYPDAARSRDGSRLRVLGQDK